MQQPKINFKFNLSHSQLKEMWWWLYRNGKVDFHFSFNDFILALALSNNNPIYLADKKVYEIADVNGFYRLLNALDAKKSEFKRGCELDNLAFNLQNEMKEIAFKEAQLDTFRSANATAFIAKFAWAANQN